ncbi:hypothetical protein [Streptomyces noursei]|nr:hypothetical protein [Streptomyces noursei]
MRAEIAESYSYLWTTECDDWILLQTPRAIAPVIYNRSDRQVLLIDDDEVYAIVVAKMKNAGIQVFDQIPE